MLYLYSYCSQQYSYRLRYQETIRQCHCHHSTFNAAKQEADVARIMVASVAAQAEELNAAMDH